MGRAHGGLGRRLHRRAVKEPDGLLGWPKVSGQAGAIQIHADSMLGEAMMMRPMVLMADEILKTAELKAKWSGKARPIWTSPSAPSKSGTRAAAWRAAPEGGLWVVQ